MLPTRYPRLAQIVSGHRQKHNRYMLRGIDAVMVGLIAVHRGQDPTRSKVASMLLSQLRLSQYCTTRVNLEPAVKKLLWHNRALLSGHSTYVVPLVHCVAWGHSTADAQCEELLALFQSTLVAGKRGRCCDGPRSGEREIIMCSSLCHSSVGALDAMHLLGLRVPAPRVFQFCTDVLDIQDTSMLSCFVPWLIRLVLSLTGPHSTR